MEKNEEELEDEATSADDDEVQEEGLLDCLMRWYNR